MTRVSRAIVWLRLTGVLAAAELVLHQLRYLLAYGSNAGQELAAQGHSYLPTLGPAIAILLGAALGATLLSARFARHPESIAAWGAPACTIALLFTFTTQEMIEGLVSAGHPHGIAAVLGEDGWVALPLSILIGAIASLALLGLELGESALRTRRPTAGSFGRAPIALGLPRRFAGTLPAAAPLAFGLARRPPPSPVRFQH